MDLPAPLTRKETTRLIRLYRNGDDAAGKKIIEHNLRYAWHMARKYSQNCTHLTTDDLFQEAVIGMMSALERYKPKLGAFLTYARYWVRRAIVRALEEQEYAIRVPNYLQTDMRMGRGSQRKWTFHAENSRKLVYLDGAPPDEALGEAGNGSMFTEGTRHATVADETELEDMDSTSYASYVIKSGLHMLDERERGIIQSRFGLVDGEKKTLDEVGARFGLCRERVRQIEVIALQKLRERIGGNSSDPLLMDAIEA